MSIKPRPLRERFEEKVDRSGGPQRCHPWLGYRNWAGYGRICKGVGGGVLTAPRVAWELMMGEPVPDGTFVCHSCDNPGCVNPLHLFVGSQQDNVDDMRRKGRHAHGERMGTAKLTEDEVREIRRLKGLEPPAVTAERCGINYYTVHHIRSGKRWAHLL